MSDLVERLSQGEHPVEISLRPERTAQAFKDCLDRGYVHVKFTDTRGGTELGIPLDLQRSDLTNLNFDAETGRATIVGELTLDFVKVRCVATVELPSLNGSGHLEPIGESVAAS